MKKSIIRRYTPLVLALIIAPQPQVTYSGLSLLNNLFALLPTNVTSLPKTIKENPVPFVLFSAVGTGLLAYYLGYQKNGPWFKQTVDERREKQEKEKLEKEKLEIDTTKNQFKQPSNIDKKQFLLLLLDKTKLTNEVSDTDLVIYANTIRDLCKNRDLCKKTSEFNARRFSLINCYPLIDEVIIEATSEEGETKFYKPRSPEEKVLTKQHAQKLVEELSKWLAEKTDALKNFIFNPTSTPLKYCYTPTAEPWKDYLVRLECSQDECGSSLDIIIRKKDKDIGCLGCSIWENKLKARSDMYIEGLYIKDRQKGLGTALLSTIRELVKSLKKEVKLSLDAVPKYPEMLPILIKFYKEFGFCSKLNKKSRLKLYIDKDGSVIKTFEIAAYRKKRQQIFEYEKYQIMLSKLLNHHQRWWL